MSFDSTIVDITNDKQDKKPYDRVKNDDLQISRTDMNMLIMNYLVTGKMKNNLFKSLWACLCDFFSLL